ncbi:translation initiation factor IF-2 [Candidatus Roizmanbacteria bacterium RIFCSPHIGHO2_01_FULL_39_12c]|uniref:Translation initiation factor IF-2 n=1 Tax=Candidatus Roizmanbacteria bacterium RIFCSPHIGHO2_01_FULL_39_12c TaxID=1802031 RepID=A0A1F7GDI0_9BACT|nr:MAG: translation initiation factor IF-2 [Candidatus Roizmanbacteria bacterium RIFCSPHIGHO2_01_FULL_39_12c]
MANRPPIVTILGHVDHGKTTLLDFIRKTSLVEKEHGGITQKIGAYEIFTDFKGYNTNRITFIDTPGHEAFSKLRSRGANVADIAILVVDAKDSLKPQTVESISHIKSANIPFIVAVNKIDLPEANPEKVKNDLLKHSIVVEGKGGGIPLVLVSAKTGKGIDELLETILLLGSDLNLTYDPNASPKAVVIETNKDRRGAVVSAVLKEGRLKVGDQIQAGDEVGKVRALINDRGSSLQAAEPSTPFELMGFSQLPDIGSVITLRSDFARTKSSLTTEKHQMATNPKSIDLDTLLHPKLAEKKLALIIKADSHGSLEAINESLSQNKNVELILSSIGDIHKSDIFLAKSTKAILIGFSVPVSVEARLLAKQEKVIIKTYNIIYNLLDELTEVADLLKEKQQQEKSLKGSAKILANFIIKSEKVFGVKVTKGKINLGDGLEVYRGDNMFGKTKLVSLKIRAKIVSEVKKDQEAGMVFSPQLDINIGDVVKCIL